MVFFGSSSAVPQSGFTVGGPFSRIDSKLSRIAAKIAGTRLGNFTGTSGKTAVAGIMISLRLLAYVVTRLLLTM